MQSQPESGREPVLEGSSTQVLHCSHWLLEVAVPSSGHTAELSAASSSCCRTRPLRKWEGVWSQHKQSHSALCLQPAELGQGSHIMLCPGTMRTCRWPCTEPAWADPELVQSLGMLMCLCCCAPLLQAWLGSVSSGQAGFCLFW